jgi:hypothetical protein
MTCENCDGCPCQPRINVDVTNRVTLAGDLSYLLPEVSPSLAYRLLNREYGER